jgi:hypothetical protein
MKRNNNNEKMKIDRFCCYLLLFRTVSSWTNRPGITGKYARSVLGGAQRINACSAIRLQSSRGSNVELIEPTTRCQVILVGCFHGSQSSARDVELALSERTDAVVLELCANRFADLKRGEMGSNKELTRPQPWIERFSSMVTQTVKKRGLSTAAAAAVLGGVGGLQSALSGLEPGLEFTTALRLASDNSDIVLADQDVDDILNRLGNLPETSVSLWKNLIDVKNWDQSLFATQSVSLTTALLGDANMNQYVTLPRFLTRNEAAVRDLVRLFLPPLIMLESINVALGYFLERLLSEPPEIERVAIVNDLSPVDIFSSFLEPALLFPVIANVAFLFAVYLSVALPATQIILSDRDDQLAAGVRSACQIAMTRAQGERPGRVVAVLGFLHVNGVARRLNAPTVKVRTQATT